MKTHDLKPLEAVKDFYGLNEQLTGDKLSANLSNIVMSFWHDLTSPFVADPDSFDIHSHGIDGPYRCIKMTPGADVIERVYDRVDSRASDLVKALNKAFNSSAFDLKIRRENGELDLMVAFTGAEGGIFTCNSLVQGGSFAVALRIPNDEEMKVTFDSMAQVPTPSNVDQGPAGPELEPAPADDFDDIPETDPQMDDGIPMEGAFKKLATDEEEMERLGVQLYKAAPADVKNQLPKAVAAFMRDNVPQYAKDKGFDPKDFQAVMRDIIQDKGEITEEMEDNKPKGAKIDRPDFQDEPFEPAQGDLDTQDLDQEKEFPIDEQDGKDLATRLGTIEGALQALITQVDDGPLKDEIQRLIGIAQLPRPDLLRMGESLRLIMRAIPLLKTEEMPDMEPGDAPIVDYEDYEDAQQYNEGMASNTQDYVNPRLVKALNKAGITDWKAVKKAGYTSYEIWPGYEIAVDGKGITVMKDGKKEGYFDRPKRDYKKAVEQVKDGRRLHVQLSLYTARALGGPDIDLVEEMDDLGMAVESTSNTQVVINHLLPKALRQAGIDCKVVKKIGYTSYNCGNGYEIVNNGVGITVKKDGKEVSYIDQPRLNYRQAVELVQPVTKEDVAGMSVSNMGGNVPGHDAGPGPVVKREKKPQQESTSYRYVSLEKLNPFQR